MLRTHAQDASRRDSNALHYELLRSEVPSESRSSLSELRMMGLLRTQGSRYIERDIAIKAGYLDKCES